ncbi:PAS domain-containing protein, partial [Staphylococcus sp. 231237_7MaSpsaltlick]
FDHLVNKVLSSNAFKDDYLAGYEFITKDGRRIKSSTTLIRNSSGSIIGALCINFDITIFEKIQHFIKDILPLNKNDNYEYNNNNNENVKDITEDLINKIIANSNYPNLKRQEKIDLIKFMDEKGIF